MTAERSAEFSPLKRALATSNMVTSGPVVAIVTKQAVGITIGKIVSNKTHDMHG